MSDFPGDGVSGTVAVGTGLGPAGLEPFSVGELLVDTERGLTVVAAEG